MVKWHIKEGYSLREDTVGRRGWEDNFTSAYGKRGNTSAFFGRSA